MININGHNLIRYIYILLLLITVSRYEAQTFYKTYDVDTKADFVNTSDIILTNDSCYVIVCTSYDSSLASHTIELIRSNAAGTMIWRKIFLCPNTPYLVNIVESPDSGFFISGSYEYPTDTTCKVLLIKTDKNGSKQWVKLLGDNKLTQWNYDLQIVGGNLYILSEGYIKMTTTQYQNAYFVTKTDLLGNVIWYNLYNWSGAPYPKTFIVSKNEEIYVSGEINSFGYNYLALSKIDSSGGLLWSKIYTPTNDIDPLDIMIDSSNNLVLTGHIWISNAKNWDIFLMKMDSAGNFKWGKTYGGFNPDEGWAIFQNTSGYVICAEPESFPGYTSRGSLIQTDSIGNMQWMKIYGDTTGSFPNGALQLRSGFVIYGIKGSYASTSSIYLLRTDPNGISPCKWFPVSLPDSILTLIPIDSGYSGSVQGTMIYDLNELILLSNDYDNCDLSSMEQRDVSNLRVYPNPNSGVFQIGISNDIYEGEIVIQNLLGETVHRQSTCMGVNHINCVNLSKGLYVYVILSKNEVTRSGRFIIE